MDGQSAESGQPRRPRFFLRNQSIAFPLGLAATAVFLVAMGASLWWSAGWHREARTLCQEQAAETHARMFSALMDGYQLICARLQRTLAEHQIRRIDCVGRAVDPTTMTVVELTEDPQAASETVAAELRPGYTWRGTVVRFAEVRAVRRERTLEPVAAGPPDELRQPSPVGEKCIVDPT